MLLIIDNYDSFVYNIVHKINYPINKIIIKRNDQLTIEDLYKWHIERIIISPGPMTPRETGIANDIILHFGNSLPILGICLGHQCIGHVYSCKIQQHPQPTHGQSSDIYLKSSQLFANLPKIIQGARYHSLYVADKNFNHRELKITARLKDGTIMAIEHKHYPIFGVQFHPESILSYDYGEIILNNFCKIK